MTFYKWIENNHTEMLAITGTICGDPKSVGDLYGCVVEQLLNKQDKLDKIPDKQKKYYFINVVKTNWFSKTSPYHYQYRKPTQHHRPIIENIIEQIEDEEYVESIPTMEWVKNTLEKDFDWYSRDLFLLYVELKTLTNVSKQTSIPLNSVGRHIKQIKTKLKELWHREQQN